MSLCEGSFHKTKVNHIEIIHVNTLTLE